MYICNYLYRIKKNVCFNIYSFNALPLFFFCKKVTERKNLLGVTNGSQPNECDEGCQLEAILQMLLIFTVRLIAVVFL